MAIGVNSDWAENPGQERVTDPSEDPIQEMVNELSRHHRDFARISQICDNWRNAGLKGDDAMILIQNIVG